MKIKILRFLSSIGFPVKPVLRYFKPFLLERIKIVRHHNIDTVLDIGANAGQYSMLMRTLKYKGRIISFEPLSSAFGRLQKNSASDKKWTINNFALGDKEETATINVSENSFSSSILDIKQAHVDSAPESNYTHTEEITVKTLDSVFDQFCSENDQVMVKIDTQGFEKNVIDGGVSSLAKVKLLQLEMSLVELYENEMLFNDMVNYLKERGFTLVSLEPGFSNRDSGELLQVDGIFVNEAMV